MPGGFPSGISICNGQSVGASTGTSSGTTITASATINTKGSYTSLIASTAFDCCFAIIGIVNPTANLILVDIAIGPGGSQKVIVPNIFCGAVAGATGSRCSLAIAIPISIAPSQQIWAACQSATASATCSVNMQLFGGSFSTMPGVAGYDDLGTSLAASTGTLITPSATTQTLGTWTSLISSTARAYIGIFGTIGFGTANINYLTNFGIGPSTPSIIIPNWPSRSISASGVGSSGTLPFLPIQIPKGTDIWAQNQAGGASEAGQSIALYGAYQ